MPTGRPGTPRDNSTPSASAVRDSLIAEIPRTPGMARGLRHHLRPTDGVGHHRRSCLPAGHRLRAAGDIQQKEGKGERTEYMIYIMRYMRHNRMIWPMRLLAVMLSLHCALFTASAQPKYERKDFSFKVVKTKNAEGLISQVYFRLFVGKQFIKEYTFELAAPLSEDIANNVGTYSEEDLNFDRPSRRGRLSGLLWRLFHKHLARGPALGSGAAPVRISRRLCRCRRVDGLRREEIPHPHGE